MWYPEEEKIFVKNQGTKRISISNSNINSPKGHERKGQKPFLAQNQLNFCPFEMQQCTGGAGGAGGYWQSKNCKEIAQRQRYTRMLAFLKLRTQIFSLNYPISESGK